MGVAVRVSDHPVVIALCEAFGAPLVSTSANLAGEPPAFSRVALDPQLLAHLDGVTEGETGGLSAPTAIRDALSGFVLRVGPQLALRARPNRRVMRIRAHSARHGRGQG
jgi:L-threonylcarbamoyladenylate synthase